MPHIVYTIPTVLVTLTNTNHSGIQGCLCKPQQTGEQIMKLELKSIVIHKHTHDKM